MAIALGDNLEDITIALHKLGIIKERVIVEPGVKEARIRSKKT